MIHFELIKKLRAPSGEMNLHVESTLEQGNLLSIYGHSGAGKSSILRILAGLMKPDEGKIIVDGEIWFDSVKGINKKPQERNLGIVFQDYGLFPNMTVLQNLQFALSKTQKGRIIQEMIEVMELGALADKKPAILSGGQQQRVALARAMIRRPKLLLLDEPLSALDHELRVKMQEYVLKIHEQYHLHTILVSHQLNEVIRMSDYLIMMKDGQVTKHGKPSSILFNESDSGKLQGIIIDSEDQEGILILKILVGEQIIEYQVKKTSQKNYNKGERITFNVQL